MPATTPVYSDLTLEAHQDHVALGAGHVAQYAEDNEVHGLGLGAFENCVRHTFHAGLDLLKRHDRNIRRSALGE